MPVCKECRQEGEVIVRGDTTGPRTKVKVLDFITHLPTCGLAPKVMPAHLRSRAWEGHERRTQARLDVHATPASGSLNEDGDGRAFHHWRLECKYTASNSYALTQDTWAKLVQGALRAGEEPVLDIEFKPTAMYARRVAVVRADFWRGFEPQIEDQLTTRAYIPRTRARCSLTSVTRGLLGLDPLAMAVDELDFQRVKKELDALLS